ncbi:hypothetical protein [Mesorhizobium sp. CN2-181]|uniref:hypothetical protein n=1 Tax=Mesorhizobium yinganensis TaxID=3157707 RepID=UPI0032B7D54F
MDWNAAIDKNREALKRILAMLVAMAGLAAGAKLGAGAVHGAGAGLGAGELGAGELGAGEPGAGGQFFFFPRKGAAASRLARAEKNKLSPALTLPRRLHRAICKLLRPAEAAARRLIIVAARGLVVALPPRRPRLPKPKNPEPLLRSFGIAVTLSRDDLRRAAAARRAAEIRAARPKRLSLPLLDPLHNPFRVRRRYVPPHEAPRIVFPGIADPSSFPRPPSPRDPIDAERLALRLEALGRALDDLPGQAKRFARWKARRDAALAQRKQGGDAAIARDSAAGGADTHIGGHAAAGSRTKQARGKIRFHRIEPLKPGRPPGWSRKPTHEVHEVLDVVHGLACWILQSPDTS